MRSFPICVLAVGSSRGDDRLGLAVVERLPKAQWGGVKAVAVSAPSRLLDHLDDCQALILVDACRSGGEAGQVFRFTWPSPELAEGSATSSHGLGVVGVLRLAETLGRLPQEVVVFSMEMGTWQPEEDFSPAVQQALPHLLQQIAAEIDRLNRPLDQTQAKHSAP